MATPQFIEEHPVSLVDVAGVFEQVEVRDKGFNPRCLKVKEFLESFPHPLSVKKKAELYKKLQDLGLTRIRDEHIVKIVDFMPKDVTELKVVLVAYPLSLPKKDQDSIVAVVCEFV